jgi:excisionase family DNA binding protein
MANIVTAKELGQYLKLSESTIYKLASVGDLPGFKIGDSWRFDMDEVIKMIKASKKRNNKEERGISKTVAPSFTEGGKKYRRQ